MNQNPVTVGLAVVFVLSVAMLLIWQGMRGGAPGPGEAYYYDSDAGRIFIASADALPPIQTPSGSEEGVLAHIYACGECVGDFTNKTPDELEQQGAFVAFFDRYEAETRALLERAREGQPSEAFSQEEQMRLMDAREFGSGRLVRRPRDRNWVRIESEAGMRITEETAMRRCAGVAPARRCLP